MTSVPEEAPETQDGSRKKRRLQNACDECRRRKVRCDSATQPNGICSGCLSLKVKCTHIATRKKRGPKIGAPSHTTVKAIVTSVESGCFVIPEDHESIRDVLDDLTTYIRWLEKELTRARRKETLAEISPLTSSLINAESPPSSMSCGSHSSPQSVDSVEDSEWSETEELSEHVANMRISRMQNRHFGKSSGTMFLMSALNVKNAPEIVKRMEFWTPFPWQITKPYEPEPIPFEFPEVNLLQNLIEIYFTSHDPYYPLLHRASFERAISRGLHLRDRHFGGLVLAVCSVASRYSNDQRNLPEIPCSNLGLGWRWFRQLALTRTNFVEPVGLYELQTYCLSCLFLQTTYLSDAGWVLNGFAIRLAQERGIHRRKDPGAKPTLERELWKKAFWQLIAFDIITSISFGRPRATMTDDFDIEPLIECDDDAWEDPAVDVSELPPAKHCSSAYFNCYMGLLETLGFCQRALYPVRRSELTGKMGLSSNDWTQKAVMEVDSALNGWMDTIPDHLKWDPHCENETFFVKSVMLYAMYYLTQIQVHRSFIPKPGETASLNFPSMAICTNAARSCIHLIDSYRRRGLHPIGGSLVPSLFNACIVLCLNVYRGKELKLNIDPRRDLQDIYKAADILHTWEDRHQVAGRFYDIINALYNARLPVPSHVESLKRPRESESHSSELAEQTAATASSITQVAGTQRAFNVMQNLHSNAINPEVNYTSNPYAQPFSLPLSSTQLGDLPVHQHLDSATSETWSNLPASYPQWNPGAHEEWSGGLTQNTSYVSPVIGSSNVANMGQTETTFGGAVDAIPDWDCLMNNIDQLLHWHSAT